jgi:LacI family transcriptional regulator
MNKNPKVPTLEDVASYAGVSTATVSRSLNFPKQVSEKTHKIVMKSIKKLGYAPNFNAQALAAKRTNTVGAIIPTMENAIFARGLQAFQEELGSVGITLLLASSSYNSALEEKQIMTLIARGADALLLIGHRRSPEIYKFLKKRKIPVLIAWIYNKNAEQTSIGFDNHKAIKPLVEKAIELGHRNIGFISAPTLHNDRAENRLNGVLATMASSGLDPNDLKIVETPYSITNGEIAFKKLMSYKKPPTLVICGNDVFAVGAVKYAKFAGYNVPNDVSITGFDDIELASVISPELTTIHVPHREMGKLAAQMLVKMIKGGEVDSFELKTTLKLRRTLGAPKT